MGRIGTWDGYSEAERQRTLEAVLTETAIMDY